MTSVTAQSDEQDLAKFQWWNAVSGFLSVLRKL